MASSGSSISISGSSISSSSISSSNVAAPALDMTVTMTADAVPTEAEKESLKGVFADELGVDLEKIENFQVSEVVARRRQLLSITLEVSFTVLDASEEDMEVFEEAVEAPEFTQAVEDNAGIIVTVEEVTSEEVINEATR